MNKFQELEKEIQNIKARNTRVEADKAWEVSTFRKGLIALLTYFIIVVFFHFADLPQPFINAIVPTVGFVLSTVSVPVFKKLWLRYLYKR